MCSILTDPALFNYAILTLYVLAMGRWAVNGSWLHVVYWAGATMLQVVVTIGLKR